MNSTQAPIMGKINRFIPLLEKEKIRFENLTFDSGTDNWLFAGAVIKNPAVLKGLLECELLKLLYKSVWYITICEGVDADPVNGSGIRIEYGTPDRIYYGEDLFDACFKAFSEEIQQ